MKNWNVRKAVVAREDMPEEHRLKQSLSWPHLVALGVGAIVGTGILTLIGVGAGKAGPAVILSFAIAGVICACAALAYAEVATMIPASGSAYTYSYVVFGELIAWMIGVALILEYTLVVSAVAVGWSGYAAGFLKSVGLGLPDALVQGPELGGVINLPAIFIIWVVAGLLIAGTRESATLNAILVLIKMAALALVHRGRAAGVRRRRTSIRSCPTVSRAAARPGSEVGVMAAAAIIFFAFYGFDAIATAAEEAKNPSRDLAIGIVGSMVVCVLIYMVVAAAAIGAVAYTGFANSAEPLALILREIGQPWAARVLGASAVIALPTVILAFFYGQSRIFFTVARDGLLPSSLARVSRRGTPVRITIFTAIVTSVFAGLIPLDRDRGAGQCRDARGLHRGMRRDAGAAPPRAGPRAQVPRARRACGRARRHPRLPLSVHQPAQPDAAVLRHRAGDRPGALRHLRQRRRAQRARAAPRA